MVSSETVLLAHLLRRAGFSATPQELEIAQNKGYDQTLEDLLNPGAPQDIPQDLIRRLHVDQSELRQAGSAGANWLYRMITTNNPLEEKLTLFWHGLFATGYTKLNNARSLLNQIDMFRTHGLGKFSELLIELSKDPAMLLWLDNNENHDGAINENYGRELLELFSMGIGSYSEHDIKECARAFTGWTLANVEYMSTRAMKDSIWPYGRIAWHFEYRQDDHDYGEKSFLGETGDFNGEDIVDIIARQQATARFICWRLFLFFAADEVNEEGERVIQEMMASYFESNSEIRSVLRTLFNSSYFKSKKARFAHMKGPVELVVGGLRFAGSYDKRPVLGVETIAQQTFFMGQGLLMPPTVEGWHEGDEWVDSGALVERINFVSNEMRNVNHPGIRYIIDHLSTLNGGRISPQDLVDNCLQLVGQLEAAESTRHGLIEYVSKEGPVNLLDPELSETSATRVGDLLGLIASTREFQLA